MDKERFKILIAIFSLRRFTTPDLATFCSISQEEALQWLEGETEFVEKNNIGDGVKLSDFGNNGNNIAWNIKPNSEDRLHSILYRVSSMSNNSLKKQSDIKKVPKKLRSLEAAENYLLSAEQERDTSKAKEYYTIAETWLETAEETIKEWRINNIAILPDTINRIINIHTSFAIKIIPNKSSVSEYYDWLINLIKSWLNYCDHHYYNSNETIDDLFYKDYKDYKDYFIDKLLERAERLPEPQITYFKVSIIVALGQLSPNEYHARTVFVTLIDAISVRALLAMLYIVFRNTPNKNNKIQPNGELILLLDCLAKCQRYFTKNTSDSDLFFNWLLDLKRCYWMPEFAPGYSYMMMDAPLKYKMSLRNLVASLRSDIETAIRNRNRYSDVTKIHIEYAERLLKCSPDPHSSEISNIKEYFSFSV